MTTAIDPKELSDDQLNEDSTKVVTLEEIEDENREERFGLPPPLRVVLLSATAGGIGALGGMAHGYSQASLKYLASNSHRLPTHYNGWFMYHKRKMYYCLKEGMGLGFRTSGKLAGFVGTIFGLEAALDSARGVKDFANTTMAVVLPGFFYAWWHRMPRIQARDFIRRGGRMGIAFGLAQDAMQFCRGVDVWYLNKFFGVQPERLTDRMRDAAGMERKPHAHTAATPKEAVTETVETIKEVK